MSLEADSWKDVVQKKIADLYKDNNNHFVRVVWALNLEEEAYKSSNQDPPHWRTLRNALKYDNLFKAYADQLAEETKTKPKNTKLLEALANLINNISGLELAPSSSLFKNDKQNNDYLRLLAVCVISGFTGFARAMSLISVDTQRKILDHLPIIIADRSLVVSVGQLTGYVGRFVGTVVVVALAATCLGIEAIRSIRLWWRGEISGARCCKNIVDSASAIGGSIAGGAVGAAIGSVAGPFGTALGCVFGALLTSEVANFLSDRLTQAIFGVPQSVALKNAYQYFGVNKNASNSEINSAYRERCKKHHPDKGGNHSDFTFTQSHMETIRNARNM